MNHVLNFLFAGVFVLIISLASFLPVSLVNVSSDRSVSLVLGASTNISDKISVRESGSLIGSSVGMTALAYPDQQTYYHNVFKVKNISSTTRKHKLDVLSVLPEDPNLSAQVYFESMDQTSVLSLKPGEENEVSLVLALGPSADGATTPRAYTLKILVLPLD